MEANDPEPPRSAGQRLLLNGCVRLQPHTLGGETLLHIERTLPLREAAESITGVKKKQDARSGGKKVCKVQLRSDAGGLDSPAATHRGFQQAQADALLRFGAAIRPALLEAAG